MDQFTVGDLDQILQGGFDVHAYFKINQLEKARSFYNNYLSYLSSQGIEPTFTSFSTATDGPHIGPNFAIHLMGKVPNEDIPQEGGAMRAIFCQGHAHIFATYCRPKGIRVLIHPNSTKRSENVAQEILDHTERATWISDYTETPACLSIDFFEKLLPVEAKQETKKRSSFRKTKSFIGFNRMLSTGRSFKSSILGTFRAIGLKL